VDRSRDPAHAVAEAERIDDRAVGAAGRRDKGRHAVQHRFVVIVVIVVIVIIIVCSSAHHAVIIVPSALHMWLRPGRGSRRDAGASPALVDAPALGAGGGPELRA